MVKIKSIIKKLFFKKKNNNSIYTKDILINDRFIIGEFTYGNPKILFSESGYFLKIGKYCSISGDTTIFLGGNHRVDWITTYPFSAFTDKFPNAKNIIGHPDSNGDVIIGNDVWIGYGVTILSGVTISDGAVIAAKSIVTKNVGPYEIWGGNPARFIKKRFDDECIKKLLELKWWDKNIEWINDNVKFLQSDKINML